MALLYTLIIVWLVALLTSTYARSSTSDTSILNILLPKALSKTLGNAPIEHSLTLLDQSRTTSSSRSGKVAFYERTAKDPCRIEFDKASVGEKPMFALIDRGSPECDLSTIVVDAQSRGIQGVIVADDVCLCAKDMSPPEDYRVKCEELAAKSTSRLAASGDLCANSLPKLQVKSSTVSIMIPVILVDWAVAQRIRDCMAATHASLCWPRPVIIANFVWNMKTDPVLFEFWTSSESEWKLKKAFAPIAPKLETAVVFQPRYVVYDAKDWGCGSDEEEEGHLCGYACLRNRYCSAGSMAVNGLAVLQENLRQLCIHRQASMGSTIASDWWKYVSRFADECGLKNYTKACSEQIQKTIPGLSVEQVRECESSSWREPDLNSLLSSEVAYRKESMITSIPALAIGGHMLNSYGASPLSLTAIMNQICERSGSPPSACSCLSSDGMGFEECVQSLCNKGERFCVADGKCYPSDGDFAGKCLSCPPGWSYCPSLRMCKDTSCPACTDPQKPYYCLLNLECVGRIADCVVPSNRTDDSPTVSVDASRVVAIVLVVVLGTLVLSYLCWWRNQRAKFRTEVVSILEHYRPLDRQGNVTRAHSENEMAVVVS